MTLEVVNLIYLIHKASFKEEGLNKVAFTTVLSENMLGPWSTQGSNLGLYLQTQHKRGILSKAEARGRTAHKAMRTYISASRLVMLSYAHKF